MVEVKVPKNIMIYESKTIGPFTTKQFVCMVVTLCFDVFLYNVVLHPMNVSVEILFYVIALADVPILAFGYYKPMGLPLDKYIKMIYHTMILAPTKRLNKKEMVLHENSNKKENNKKKNKKNRESCLMKGYK